MNYLDEPRSGSPRGERTIAWDRHRHLVRKRSIRKRCFVVGFVVLGSLSVALVHSGAAAAVPSVWSVTSTPPTRSAFASVSCVSANSCMAVGRAVNKTLAESWNGETWSVLTTPNPGHPDYPYSVSCVSQAKCMAVGYYFAPSSTLGLAMEWTGSHWVNTVTRNRGLGSYLYAVSCSSSTSCFAVGRYVSSSDTDRTLAELEWFVLVGDQDPKCWKWRHSSQRSLLYLFQKLRCCRKRQCLRRGSDRSRVVERDRLVHRRQPERRNRQRAERCVVHQLEQLRGGWGRLHQFGHVANPRRNMERDIVVSHSESESREFRQLPFGCLVYELHELRDGRGLLQRIGPQPPPNAN